MRDVPPEMVQLWQAGDFTGPYRPIARVTVQQAHTSLHTHTFPIMEATTEEIARRRASAGSALGLVDVENIPAKKNASTTYASTIFGSVATPMELTNVKSVTWNRSIDSDVAEASFEFYNTSPITLGEVPIRDEMGYYTFNRGATDIGKRWGHESNEWANMLVPDNILRTYEGYGFDPDEIPERDRHLVQTGVWLIDQVDLGTDGLIRVTARDPARLLMDHLAFLPVIPPDFYPLSFKATEKVSGEIPELTYITPVTVQNEEAVDVGVVTAPAKPPSPAHRRVRMTYNSCSDRKYNPRYFDYTVVKHDYLIKLAHRFHVPGGWREIYELNEDRFEARGDKPKSAHWIYPGQVFRIPSDPYNQYGHEPTDAFDQSSGSYWLSRGFAEGTQGRAYATEWIQGRVSNHSVSQVRFTTGGSGYSVYVSVRSEGKWVGASKVPYKAPRDGVDVDADIPYVKTVAVEKSGREVVVTFDRSLPKVDLIRLSFKNLVSHSGRRRVQLRNFAAYANAGAAPPPGKKIKTPPGYRGISDSFDRKTPIASENATLRKKGTVTVTGLGKTPQGDQWNAPGYTIKPRGTVVINDRYHTEGEIDNRMEHFVTAALDLGVRQQAVRINTKYARSGRDDVSTQDGRWLIMLRGDHNAASEGVQIYIERDGAVSVYLKTPGAGPPTWEDNYEKIAEITTPYIDPDQVVPAGQQPKVANLEATRYEISTSLIGNELMVAFRPYGSTAEPTVRLEVHEKRFANFKGTWAAFGMNNYSSQVTYFKAQTKFRRGVHDSFTRKNSASLGRAETGQTWRHSARTWHVASNDAVQTSPTASTPLALIDMYDSDQDVIADVSSLGSQGQVVLALRAASARNTLLVRVNAQDGTIRSEARIDGVGQVVKSVEAAIPSTPFLFRAVIKSGTLTVYTGKRRAAPTTAIDWTEIFSETNLAYTHEAFSYHTGFGSKGAGARVREFTGKSLGAPDTWVYRAETTVPAHFEAGAGAKPGTYEDYTDIVKLFCAWGGLYWPKDAALIYSDGTSNPLRPQKTDPVLGYSPQVGRVWGDFESSGTAGPEPLDFSIWDKKTLMDGITYVREVLGFLFHIDELGGVIWRQANIFSVGNNVASFSADPRRTAYIYDVDETRTLLSLKTALNSRNVRERIFIANITATQAGMAQGYNPNPTGLRRVNGWTDQNFKSQEECQVMADMIALRQSFRYRSSQLTIPALPAIQIDDQVRIWEEITAEGYLHYVRGVSSTNDVEGGSWTYDLTTHWLGEDPFENWAFDSSDFSEETQAYMDALRMRTGVGTDDYYELPRVDTDKMPYIAPSVDGATQIIEEVGP